MYNNIPALIAILHKITHVNFEIGEKHNIQNACSSGKDNTAAPYDKSKSIWDNYCPGNDKSQQMMNFYFVQDNGGKQNDHQDQKEF